MVSVFKHLSPPTEDMYHIMTDLPETVPYICVKCNPVRPAKWQIELEEEMEAGFQNVLRAMLNCRSASRLVNLEKKVQLFIFRNMRGSISQR